jgi:chromosome partitioning protein
MSIYDQNTTEVKKLVFFNTKGGTGKTTLCYNYGWYLALKRQKRVLFLDFDPQINLVKSFPNITSRALDQTLEKMVIRFTHKHPVELKDYVLRINRNIDVLPSSNNISLLDEYLTDYLLERCCKENKIYQALHRNVLIRRVLEEVIPEGAYDYVLIDSQPNYTLLSTTAILYAQNVAVIMRPELFSYLDVRYLLKIRKTLSEKFNVDVRIIAGIINAYESGRTINRTIVENYRSKYGDRFPILEQKIRNLAAYQMSITLERRPVFVSYPKSEASHDILSAFRQLDERVDAAVPRRSPDSGSDSRVFKEVE